MEARIRPYDPARDAQAVRECFVVLQDEEHAAFPSAPSGADIADEYLARMHRRVAECKGRMWVAEKGDLVVGFVTVLANVAREAPDDGDPWHGAVTEIVLRPEHRGEGAGARLLALAEEHVRACGAPSLRIAHHGRNAGAHGFYRRQGYEAVMVLMEKRFSRSSVQE